jgi:hypothetical protein
MTKNPGAYEERLADPKHAPLESPKEWLRGFAERLHRYKEHRAEAAVAGYLNGKFKSLDVAFGVRGRPRKRGLKVSKLTPRHAREIWQMRKERKSWKNISEALGADASSLRRVFKQYYADVVGEDVEAAWKDTDA